MKLIEINKINVARNLFNEATLLFFEKRSAISIHHLAHAAHEVLCAMSGDSHMIDSSALTPDGKRNLGAYLILQKILLNMQTKILKLHLHLTQKQIY